MPHQGQRLITPRGQKGSSGPRDVETSNPLVLKLLLGRKKGVNAREDQDGKSLNKENGEDMGGWKR